MSAKVIMTSKTLIKAVDGRLTGQMAAYKKESWLK